MNGYPCGCAGYYNLGLSLSLLPLSPCSSKLEKMPSIPEEPEQGESEVERFTMPDFLRPLHDLDVVESKEAVLECQVAGLPYPSITWFHNGRRIENTDDRRMMQCMLHPLGCHTHVDSPAPFCQCHQLLLLLIVLFATVADLLTESWGLGMAATPSPPLLLMVFCSLPLDQKKKSNNPANGKGNEGRGQGALTVSSLHGTSFSSH